ncbi:uncharacterized protein LOC141660672 [Apium graveolens]|uniref:uncharacterized protein LOC141660672 n=1 Tax=Apium graveolens TaxID=4045 RepID=UPI003D794B9F
MEKLVYALILASRKLRPYFQAHKVEVRTAYPLHHILHKPKTSGRMLKWAVELGQFDVEYKPRTVIKAQTLADFILEFSFEQEEEALVVVPISSITQDPEPTTPAPWWILKVDGAVNNEGLNLAREMRVDNLNVYGDSMLVVYQDTALLGIIPLEVKKQPSVPEAEERLQSTFTQMHCWRGGTYILREVHEEICGNHSGGSSLAQKVLRQGYYWPTLQEDASNFAKACDKCQRYANYINKHVVSLTSLVSPWPFAMWGIDLIGELPKVKGGVKYAVVAVDYFTKWAEAEPLTTITAKRLRDFIYRSIVCHFGISYKLISDNGKQFDSKEVRELCDNLGIVKGFSAVSHPQTNGQTEVNEVNHLLHLDMLEEIRSKAQLRIAAYQQRVARHYNTKVKARPLQVGDLVRRRVMPNTKVQAHGILGANWEGPYKVRAVL